MSSIDQNKLLVRRYYAEVVNTGDVDRIPEFVSSDYVENYNGTRNECGIEGAKAHIQAVRSTFADLNLTVEQQVAEGGWVVSQVTARGFHTGEWMEMKPTGKAVEIRVVNVDRIINGKIAEHGGAANMLESLLLIGAVKVVGPAD
jgi:predicted ester cyclase